MGVIKSVLSLQVSASVANYLEVIRVTKEAWYEVERATFVASWIVTGYFEQSHFPPDLKIALPNIDSVGEAKKILDPTGLLDGTALLGTPQYCTRFEWRIQDPPPTTHSTEHLFPPTNIASFFTFSPSRLPLILGNLRHGNFLVPNFHKPVSGTATHLRYHIFLVPKFHNPVLGRGETFDATNIAARMFCL